MRAFPISNWTEMDVWNYIRRENIEIVDLYFAKPRPVVERDGVLIMVDDERLPLRDGREARRSATSGSAPSAATRCPARSSRRRPTWTRSSRDERVQDVRARRSPDRRRGRRFDGSQEGGGLLLMTHARDRGTRPWNERPTRAVGGPAHGRLRLGRRRQVDADRPAARRDRLGADRPAGVRPAHPPRRIDDPRRRDRLLAADRRPGGRAGAGHHDRRRLPTHGPAQRPARDHRRRPRSRAVHAQHGGRGVDRRPGRSCWSTPPAGCGRRPTGT